MILPNKYVTLTESYIGISALILETIADKKLTVDKLWSKFQRKYILSKKINTYPTYQKFIYILEFMYLCSMISYTDKGEILNENLKVSN
ncbi:hypothetical protein LGL08_00015 [Clostridium estertheticum]|uniref:ABC-three component system middle component 6 n=1 Tax=Clostridium estertheticum TaxID=238834 RepID=UPI001CF3FDA8|nr:ABC-three component system middle component 6 [Clostridium estertheticum]MCB2305600.1 hypothetical protein [Clostridium estertheticum]MCB2344584.1 hypothetical protein [Clostridium estertheticum]MCB2347956.1 hypothetical protein [Clostridium estertheticum]WAG45600.1 hypothetical protein LL127_19095 [Clostridium estertheticum]